MNVIANSITGKKVSDIPAVKVVTQVPTFDESDDDIVILNGLVYATVYAVKNPVNLVVEEPKRDTSSVNTSEGSESQSAVAAFHVNVV